MSCTTAPDVGPVTCSGFSHATGRAEAATATLSQLIVQRMSPPWGVRFGSSTGMARDRVR